MKHKNFLKIIDRPTIYHDSYFQISLLICTDVACVVGPNVNSSMSSTDFSFQNLVFHNVFEFSTPKINIPHILNPNLTK
jgi:hypothetical protein